jgi:3-hydroxyacyl-CoA dehydrogenase
MEIFWETLAEGLGITVEEAQSAVGDAAREALQPFVEAGRLTPDQVEKLVERLQRGQFLIPMRARHQVRQRVQQGLREARIVLPAAAEALGMEPRELLQALRGGHTLADVADQQSVEHQAVIDAIVAGVEEALNQAVEQERISPEQAQQGLEKVTQFLEERGLNFGLRFFFRSRGQRPHDQAGPQSSLPLQPMPAF